jgi:hypothetical protein
LRLRTGVRPMDAGCLVWLTGRPRGLESWGGPGQGGGRCRFRWCPESVAGRSELEPAFRLVVTERVTGSGLQFGWGPCVRVESQCFNGFVGGGVG